MAEKSTKAVIWILLVVVLVLLLFIAYMFLIRPAYTGFVAQQQNLGAQYGYNLAYQEVVNNMIAQLQQTGYVQLNVGNQTIILTPVQRAL